jgi:hypothetical protein
MTAAKSTTSERRAAASRRNGARSKGPRSAAGKARSAMNALKHGFRARTPTLLPDEDEATFAAFAEAVAGELQPAGALQTDLVARIAIAAWRARRADRLEAALLGRHLAGSDDAEAALGNGLIRDGHGPRALETLLRYRGSVLAEMFRSLAALKALQAEAASLVDITLEALAPPATTERTQETVG